MNFRNQFRHSDFDIPSTFEVCPSIFLSIHDADVTSVAFTPDGAAIVSGSHDQTVKRTNLATDELEWQSPGYFEQVNSVALSHDGSLLVTGSSDQRFARVKLDAGAPQIGPGAVRLWDVRTGHMLRRLGGPADQVMDTRAKVLSRVEFTFEAGRVVSAAGWQRSFQTGRIQDAPAH